MKKILFILFIDILMGCGPNIPKDDYSKERDTLHLYYVKDCGYTSFERWMWDEGFPDTIIVKFTRDGKFEMYVEACRYGLLEDSLGNFYSPGYAFISGVGDIWIYDIKGKFIKFIENDLPHSNMGHTYNP